MNFLSEFIRMRVPSHEKEMPAYYRRALMSSEILLAVCFLIHVFLFIWIGQPWGWLSLILLGSITVGIYCTHQAHPWLGITCYAAIILLWCGWYVYTFGWGCGGQHFLIPLLILVFFNIYIPSWRKILYFAALITFRMFLYAWTLANDPVIPLARSQSIAFQTVNSVLLFLTLALVCILLSSSLQDTERKLRIENEELSVEAGTDPLTGLPNRRAMINEINAWLRRSGNSPFCVAIADIDFFKRVNDTYGHDCGDVVLKELTKLFTQMGESKYQTCRWGGEEFCFFLPEMNLDEAGSAMIDLCAAVGRMPLSYNGNDFKITITIGVEETDYASPLDCLLKSADQKLYRGKEAGRNRVMI